MKAVMFDSIDVVFVVGLLVLVYWLGFYDGKKSAQRDERKEHP